MSFGSEVLRLLDERGHDAAWLAGKTGIARSTISNWTTKADTVPKPSSVAAVALALGVSVESLAASAGYTMTASKSDGERQRRLEALAEGSPRVAKVMLQISDLDARRQDEVLSMLEAYLATHRHR